MSSDPSARPPLPPALKRVIGLGVLLFLLPFAYLGGFEPTVVLVVGVVLVLAVLVVAFGMLRDFFSRTRPRPAPSRPSGGGKLGVLVLATLGASSALAHAVERDTSFFQLDVQSALVAAVEIHEGGIASARATVRAVFRAPTERAPSVGDEVTLSLPPFQIDSGTFVRGVVFCFAQRSRRGWTVVTGPHMGTVRTPAQYAEDGLLDFLGLKVGEREIREAMSRHVELAPSHLEQLHGDLREVALPLVTTADGKRRFTPLADQRMGVLAAWVGTGNRLLALSALVDAFELADEARPLDSLSPSRVLMPGVLERMEALAIRALASENWHIQSSALAVLERVGFENCPVELVDALCKRKHGEHLAIVRCEAHRFLPRCKGFGEAHLKLLVDALADPTLREGTNDWPADGIAEAAKLGDLWAERLLALAEPLAASEDWYDNEAAVRILAAIASDSAFGRLHVAYRDEPEGELRQLMQLRLLDWADPNNTAIVDMLNAPRNFGPYLTIPEQRAVETSIKAWERYTDGGDPLRNIRYFQTPVGIALFEFNKRRLDALFGDAKSGSDPELDSLLLQVGHTSALRRLLLHIEPQSAQTTLGGEPLPHAMPYLIAGLKRSPLPHRGRFAFREAVAEVAMDTVAKLPRDATRDELVAAILALLHSHFTNLPRFRDKTAPRSTRIPSPLPDTDDPDLLAIATLVCGGEDQQTARARLITMATTPGAHQAAAMTHCLTLNIAPDKQAAARLEKQTDFPDPILLARVLHLADPAATARLLKDAFEKLPIEALGKAATEALVDPDSPLHRHTAEILIPRIVRSFERTMRLVNEPHEHEQDHPENDTPFGIHIRLTSDTSLLLNRLTQHDEGYCAAAALDARSCAELAGRWGRWLDTNGANLAYDSARNCFVAKETAGGNEDQDGGSR